MIYIGNNKYKLYVGSTSMKFIEETAAPLPYDAEVEYLEGTSSFILGNDKN